MTSSKPQPWTQVSFSYQVLSHGLYNDETDIEKDEDNQLPTAASVTRIFSGRVVPPSGLLESEEEIEEFDFADMDKFRERIDALTLSSPPLSCPDAAPVQEPAPCISTMPEPERIITPSLGQMEPTAHQVSLPIDGGTHDSQIPAQVISMDDEPDARSTSEGIETTETDVPFFFVDTDPSPVNTAVGGEAVIALGQSIALEDEEDIIVYVAPRPRTKEATGSHQSSNTRAPIPATPRPITPIEIDPLPVHLTIPSDPVPQIPAPPSFKDISFSFANSPAPKAQPRYPLLTSSTAPRIRARRKEAASRRKKRQRQAQFGSFGAIMSESQLRAEVSERDPRWDERRRGDSDVDWGDESDGPGQDQGTRTGQVKEDLGVMDVDPELELDLEAMKTFVNGMNRGECHFVTMDDIADQEKMRQEDEEKEDNRGSSGDEDEVVELVKNQHEIAMIGGEEEIGVESAEEDNQDSSGDEDGEVDFAVNQQEIAMTGEAQEGGLKNLEKMEDDFISSDGDDSPRASFQTRLERLRRKAEGKRRASPQLTSGDVDSSEEDTFATHAEETADLLAEIQVSFLWNSDILSYVIDQELLDEEYEVVSGRDRKARKKLFRAIQNGDFHDLNGMAHPAG